MLPESRKLLWDAVSAADLVLTFVGGKTYEAYAADQLLRSAVERQLAIVGEALAQMSRVDAATAALVPDLPRVVAFRNVLVHGYASVDDLIVWGLVEGRLRGLRADLQRLLDG